MGLSRPTVVGKARIKDSGKCGRSIAIGGSGNVSGAGGEAEKCIRTVHSTVTEEVEVAGGNSAPVVYYLSPAHSGIAGD
jgi:hypothetical protein